MLRLLELLIKAVIFGVRGIVSLVFLTALMVITLTMALLLWKFYPLYHLEGIANDVTNSIKLKNIWK